jgi:hypothetical protein
MYLYTWIHHTHSRIKGILIEGQENWGESRVQYIILWKGKG